MLPIKDFSKKGISFGCIWIAVIAIAMAQDTSGVYPLAEAKRILFLGNSITYAGDYVSLFESFYITEYPSSRAEIINVGLPSETVSGLSEQGHANGEFPRPCLFTRLASVLEKTKPDVVFACYGMNDGIYMPSDEARFDAFKMGMERLRAALEQAGVKRIVFLTPPVHDDPEKGMDGYNLVLDHYASWLLEQRQQQGWEVADVHFTMNAYLEEQRKADPIFRLAKDGVHPGAEGHWLMAKSLIGYLDPGFNDAMTLDSFLESTPAMSKRYELVSKRQAMMKDAWLTYIGHDRPGMQTGKPIKEARKAYRGMGGEIQNME